MTVVGYCTRMVKEKHITYKIYIKNRIYAVLVSINVLLMKLDGTHHGMALYKESRDPFWYLLNCFNCNMQAV